MRMFYTFSEFTQKLTGAGPGARSTQGLRPSVPSEAPAMIFATPTKVISAGSGASLEYMGANRVPDLQKIFQSSDGVPVHLKRGYPDRLLYRTTMALTIGGALYCLMALYIAARPKSK